MRILNHLKLKQKFLILGLLALLMLILPLGIFVQQTQHGIDEARREARGAVPLVDLQRVIQLTQQHRGLSAGLLNGNQSLGARRPEVSSALRQASDAFDQSLHTMASAALLGRWSDQRQAWTELEQAVAAAQITSAESTARHTRLIAGLLAINRNLLEESGLGFDNHEDLHALITATLENTPALAERLGQMRAQGTGILTARMASPEALLAVSTNRALATEFAADRGYNMGRVFQGNAGLQQSLGSGSAKLAQQIDQVLALADQHILKAQDYTFSGEQYYQAFTQAINGVYEFNDQALPALKSLLNVRADQLQHRQWTMVGFVALMLLLVVLLSRAFVASIVKPIHHAVEVARAVAGGNLSLPIQADGSNEMADLLRSLSDMQQELARLVQGVRQGAENLATASAQIAQGNQDLSARTEDQASALQQTAASMEQLGSAVKLNAEHAQTANRFSSSASEVARHSGQVVAQVVHTMKEINEASRRIADIIGVIDGIAFQTNILALNAAVEAARAGEQGRGFAVVASEVWALAQRSAAAAKEIKELISSSVERVESGTTLVDQAGTTVEDAVQAIGRVTALMGEISSASREQSTGVSQVGEAVSQMDHATQANAALVEQMAAAAASLRGQAQELVQTVSVFTLAQSAGTPQAWGAGGPGPALRLAGA